VDRSLARLGDVCARAGPVVSGGGAGAMAVRLPPAQQLNREGAAQKSWNLL